MFFVYPFLCNVHPISQCSCFIFFFILSPCMYLCEYNHLKVGCRHDALFIPHWILLFGFPKNKGYSPFKNLILYLIKTLLLIQYYYLIYSLCSDFTDSSIISFIIFFFPAQDPVWSYTLQLVSWLFSLLFWHFFWRVQASYFVEWLSIFLYLRDLIDRPYNWLSKLGHCWE